MLQCLDEPFGKFMPFRNFYTLTRGANCVFWIEIEEHLVEYFGRLPIKSFKRILGIVPGGTLEGIAETVFGRIIIFGTFSGEAVARIPKET